jgi:hypothetical protein
LQRKVLQAVHGMFPSRSQSLEPGYVALLYRERSTTLKLEGGTGLNNCTEGVGGWPVGVLGVVTGAVCERYQL